MRDEEAMLEERRQRFSDIMDERLPVLTGFADAIGIVPGTLVVMDPSACLTFIDQWMRDQVVEREDEAWIVARLAYFIGELFVQRWGGSWFVNDIEGSRLFAQYVVGRFSRTTNPDAMVDPFSAAAAFVAEPVGRSLAALVGEIDVALDAL